MEHGFANLQVVEHPLVKRDVTIIRKKSTQQEQFRNAVSRISMVLANEIMRTVHMTEIEVETPLEITTGYKLKDEVIVVPVLRAGLGMVNGFISLIPDAKVGHVGIQRNEKTLQPDVYYSKSPFTLNTSFVILLDPMLATGGSASAALTYLKNHGAKKCAFACLVAAPEGVSKIQNDHPDVQIFTAAFDR